MIKLILISFGLAMDAFAASISKGLNMRKINYKNAFIIALFFGAFQGIMPLIGWVIGVKISKCFVTIEHWVAFFLLAFIGLKMIYEAFHHKNEYSENYYILNIKEIIVLAIITSIDAFAVGVTFALTSVENIIFSVLVIGGITFGLSFYGVIVGYKFGQKYEKHAEIIGGIILILIGINNLM
ncbi:manganese efflux pump MntP family protein [Clostridiaceae bacterium HSG29]|nr:manganese efflux pump MntP family protein [Clostridiaceae bacterium HSG29]